MNRHWITRRVVRDGQIDVYRVEVETVSGDYPGDGDQEIERQSFFLRTEPMPEPDYRLNWVKAAEAAREGPPPAMPRNAAGDYVLYDKDGA